MEPRVENLTENRTENVILNPEHSKVYVFPGKYLGDTPAEEFESIMYDTFDVRVEYLETVTTSPGCGGCGGRTDILFSVHKEDERNLFFPMLMGKIHTIENIIGSMEDMIYPERTRGYCK